MSRQPRPYRADADRSALVAGACFLLMAAMLLLVGVTR